jgi:RNA polymerase sigma-70 factor, ECF subfamily
VAMTLASARSVQRKPAVMPESDVYSELIDRYREELIHDAMNVVGARADAEDVVQETFCEVLKAPEKLEQANDILAFLLTINRCNALDRVRHKKRDSERMIRKFKLDPSRTETTGGFSSLERADFVASAIASLPARMRAVVMLHYFKHQTYKQIAEQLELPIGTVGRLLYEASKVLYSKLEIHVEKPQSGPRPPQPLPPLHPLNPLRADSLHPNSIQPGEGAR